MKRICATSVLILMAGTFGARSVWAQVATPLHDEQYPEVDIAYGATIYAARCVTCHGDQGDAIANVNLRSGNFRKAPTDRDLARFLAAGSPDAGMPPFELDSAEIAGITAYLRNMNRLDAASVTAGDASRGRAIFEGNGAFTGGGPTSFSAVPGAPGLSRGPINTGTEAAGHGAVIALD